jgi:preprotein translocase subunit SecA
VLLQTLDHLWREHLVILDHLRQVIGFRGYGQRDPLNEYKTESFELFQNLLARLREAVTTQLMRVEIVQRPPPLAPEGDLDTLEASHVNLTTGEDEMAAAAAPAPAIPGRNGRLAAAQIDPKNPLTWGKVQRNAPCPCGSGKKYKHCHGKFA